MHGFGFHTLALFAPMRLAGPLLASLPRLRIPVIVGELVAGLVLGETGFGVVDGADPTFELFANIGFALVMFVVGTHVPVRDPQMRTQVPRAWRARFWSGRLADTTALGVGVGPMLGTSHAALHAGADGFVVGCTGIAVDRVRRVCGDPQVLSVTVRFAISLIASSCMSLAALGDRRPAGATAALGGLAVAGSR